MFSNLFSGSAHPFPESLGGVAGGASAGTLMAGCVTASSARPVSLLTVAALSRRRDGVSGTLDMDGAMGGGAAGGAPPLMQGSLKPRLANPSGCAAIALPWQSCRVSAELRLTR